MQDRQVCPVRLLGWVDTTLRFIGVRPRRQLLRASICWHDCTNDHDYNRVTVYRTWLWGASLGLLLCTSCSDRTPPHECVGPWSFYQAKGMKVASNSLRPQVHLGIIMRQDEMTSNSEGLRRLRYGALHQS